ncbi:hypothetical protein GCM10010451_15130 [Streptomyces virens]|uniref:NACHT domain-containing protein n=1 Tax=Streptomyces virens TaxID=285572 RepID=A0ABP6P4S6_9ACTN|nr:MULTISPECIES: ATP-binding protein [Streptomyces]MBA8975906.1 hypothetical protein [Streptomyces calvus]MYS31576.1 ATP-binding protein [Streptomyces sp. SID7804]
MPTKVIRNPEGRTRPHDAAWLTLYPRRWWSRTLGAADKRWRTFRTDREARKSIVPNRSWRHWGIARGRFLRAYALLGTLVLLTWMGLAFYDSANNEGSWFHGVRTSSWFTTLFGFVGPVLTASLILAVFLFFWYRKVKKPLIKKARTKPHELVPTAGTLVDRIVGRHELAQVLAQALRNRSTRKPYLLVGGVGVGKTAVLVELTRMLAQQSAVPVPIRLRDMDDGELDFETMARRRFAEVTDPEVADPGVVGGDIDKAWRQLRLDDKVVVVADGLEEALLDERYREDRDNIIRRAIARADRQRLPLVIASRPHAPLEGTRAAIAELEPLSEEAALEYLVREPGAADERRLGWVVETAEIADSPIYLRIARLLQQRGLLEHLKPREDPGRLNTRSNDCSTIRLWLLDTYRQAMEDGRILDELVMDRRERQETVWVVSALACLGLLQDSLEVTFDDFVGAYLDDLRGQSPGQPDEPVNQRPVVGRLDSEPQQRAAIWGVLRRKIDKSASWTNPLEYPNECYAELARYAANGQLLGLVRGYENKVRFPHSIIQAYLGHRLLGEVDVDRLGAVVKPALRSPGPSRELLIALVLLSRHRAVTGPSVRPPDRMAGTTPGRSGATSPKRTAELLCDATAKRHDPKYFDLFAAALEIDSVDPEPLQDTLARKLDEEWEGLLVRGDQRTIEDAKLGLVRRFGAALRERDRRSRGDRPLSGRASVAPSLPYEHLFRIGTHEPSHPVRMAIAHQIASGGDAAFQALRQLFPLGTDPVAQYLAQTREAKEKLDRDYTAWLAGADADGAADPGAAADRAQQHARFVAEYERSRTTLWRHFALRAWLVPMIVGSVSDTYRNETKERLNLWLQHLAPADGRQSALQRLAGPGEPDLPISLENALAQGFKNAANRRRRHPNAHAETRAHLVKQAERMLICSRYWYAQLSLLHALCLWELPDTSGYPAGPDGADPRPPRTTPPGSGGTADGSTVSGPRIEPVRAVTRWLGMAGSAHHTAAAGGLRERHAGKVLHPFVAEAGDLVTLALETGHPERFLWIDEHRAIDNVGSTPADPERYRKHSLWIAPSAGWSVLHPRAQRLLADVLVMLNLTERDGSADDIEERLALANRNTLPPCLTHDRGPLHPERSVGRADGSEPGSTCLPTCKFRLCPYPPKAGKAQTEIEELFCRQQQALLHSRSRWHTPSVVRRTAPWVSIPVKELHAFWEKMADRNRKAPGQDERIV